MRDEVEEFLRRVAQLRAQAEAQARAQQQRPALQPQQPPPQRLTPPPPRLAPSQEEVVYLEPAEAEVVDAELAELGDSDEWQTIQPLSRVPQPAQPGRQLRQAVDQADEKMESHLHEVFDHKLGRLRKTASDSAAIEHAKPAVDVTLREIRTLLATPASIRDAIVISEVLRRPEERW